MPRLWRRSTVPWGAVRTTRRVASPMMRIYNEKRIITWCPDFGTEVPCPGARYGLLADRRAEWCAFTMTSAPLLGAPTVVLKYRALGRGTVCSPTGELNGARLQ